MDRQVFNNVVQAFVTISSPTSDNSLRKEATAFIEAFKLRNDAVDYMNEILLRGVDSIAPEHAVIVKYFSLILLESVSMILIHFWLPYK